MLVSVRLANVSESDHQVKSYPLAAGPTNDTTKSTESAQALSDELWTDEFEQWQNVYATKYVPRCHTINVLISMTASLPTTSSLFAACLC